MSLACTLPCCTAEGPHLPTAPPLHDPPWVFSDASSLSLTSVQNMSVRVRMPTHRPQSSTTGRRSSPFCSQEVFATHVNMHSPCCIFLATTQNVTANAQQGPLRPTRSAL